MCVYVSLWYSLGVTLGYNKSKMRSKIKFINS